MIDINIDNYEAFLLDYSEGVLSHEHLHALNLFVTQHPELEIDLNDFNLVLIEQEQILYKDKKLLKKNESDLISENQFIAYIENQLATSEKSYIEKSCALNPLLAEEMRLYKHTISSADTSILYPHPDNLKRNSKIIWFNFNQKQFMASAACVLLLLGVFIIWKNNTTTNKGFIIADKASHFKIKNSSVDSKHNVINKNNISTNQLPSQSFTKNQFTTNTLIKINTNNPLNKNKEEPLVDSVKTLLAIHSQTTPLNTNTTAVVQTTIKNNTSNYTVEVVSENETPDLKLVTKKKGIWAIASNALNKLNTIGVKSVDGIESENKNEYALTLGGINVKHSN